MEAADAWCLYDLICVWENEKGNQEKEKEIRKTIFSATFYYHRYKNAKWCSLKKSVKDEERKKSENERKKITEGEGEGERERENYCGCDDYL